MHAELTTIVPALRRFAYSLTGSIDDADDLLQNTLERILNKGVPEDVTLLKWAFRICRNLWIDEYRHKKVRDAAANDPELRSNQVVDGDRSIHNEITLGEVNSAMNQLPDEQRTIISLVALEGMSYKEVALTLEIPLGTVMSRLARARAALSQILHIGTPGSTA